MVISDGERNPFIACEEFLMNRIVQRNGAAPPWVELQAGKLRFISSVCSPGSNTVSVEMESAITSFRGVLRQAWSRRVLFTLTTLTPPPSLERLTRDYVMDLRDPEWEERERSYHEAALDEVNSLVRKHNAMAPYIARRALYTLNSELERTYKESAQEIHQELVAKLSGNPGETTPGSGRNDGVDDFTNPHGTPFPSLSLWAIVKELFTRVGVFRSLWRLAESFHSGDVGLGPIAAAEWIDELVRHRDGGIKRGWLGKIPDYKRRVWFARYGYDGMRTKMRPCVGENVDYRVGVTRGGRERDSVE